MNFSEEYINYQNIVETWIESVITRHLSSRAGIHKAMEYSLAAGGKRVRPILSVAVNDMLEGDRSLVMPYATAIELIHTYSLIHDDLPCMDNDDFRRGRPTNHKVFGESMAVLAGDGLLNLAYEIMLNDIVKGNNQLQKAEAARLIADAAGISGMVRGQAMDMEAENRDISYEQLCVMHKKKTGALIKAAVLAPAVLLGAKEEILAKLEVYSDNIGLAFQIKDDILDYEGSMDVVGKPVGSDKKNNKATFVSKLGIEKARELLMSSVREAVESLKTIDNNEFLADMAVFIAQRNK